MTEGSCVLCCKTQLVEITTMTRKASIRDSTEDASFCVNEGLLRIQALFRVKKKLVK